MNYNLKILIDAQTVMLFIQLQQKVVLVKGSGEGRYPVAWAAFAPFQMNTIVWNQDYGVYASSTESAGARIVKTAYTPATPQQCYTFFDGIFQPPIPDPSIPENTYVIKNSMNNPQVLTFGLAQDVTVNGAQLEGNPINAVQVMFNELAAFSPKEKVNVFMAAEVDDGMVITHVIGQSLQLDFTKQSDITIKYDPSAGRFVVAS